MINDPKSLIEAQQVPENCKLVLQKCDFGVEHFDLLPSHVCELDISSNELKIDLLQLFEKLDRLPMLNILFANRNNVKFNLQHLQDPSGVAPVFYRLKKLHLRNNSIQAWPSFIDKAENLTSLDLSFNELKQLHNNHTNEQKQTPSNNNSSGGSFASKIFKSIFIFFFF